MWISLSSAFNDITGAARRGLTLMIPFLLVGSFSLVLTSVPLPGYHRVMAHLFGPEWSFLFRSVFKSSFGILALIMVLTQSYSYASEKSDRRSFTIDPLICSIVSLCSFFAASGIAVVGFDVASLGATGLFAAIVVSSLSARLFVALCRVKRLRLRGFADGLSTVFNDALAAVIPAMITIGSFAAANTAFVFILGSRNAQTLLSSLLNSFFESLGNSPASGILFILLTQLFWSVGIHGNNMLESVAQNLFVPAVEMNHNLINSGLPPQDVFTKTFFDVFVFMGGSGSTLCLMFAILLFARRKNLRRHAKLSTIPVLFNVNELLVFGLPIVLNPLYVLPFIFIPVLLTVVSYLATLWGFVPHTAVLVEWTTPVLLGGYSATQSWRGCALQLFNIALGVFCYAPFVRLAERATDERMRVTLRKVYGALEETHQLPAVSPLMTRRDDIGGVCRVLAADLEYDLANGRLALAYQPQIAFDGSVAGVEALLRWNHEAYGPVAPPVAVALAEETGQEDRLGAWIIDTACRDLRLLIVQGFSDIVVSINVSARQLESGDLLGCIAASMKRHGVPARNLKIEVTEKDALAGTEKTLERLHSIKALGLKLAMDDFGMGHSSILYLKDYEFDTIKLDGSLVTGLFENKTCGEIIASVANLGKALSFSVMAEFVETEAQREVLHKLGCDQYQGYLYSPALPLADLSSYLAERRRPAPIPASAVLA